MAAKKSGKSGADAPSSEKAVSGLKSASNRRNARNSTGPRTEAGKEVVSRNGLVHGLRSPRPVLAGIESESAWQEHRRRLVGQMAPEGALETALAERIALGFWRLGRCSDAESGVLLAVREDGRLRALRHALIEEQLKRPGQATEAAFAQLLAERDRLVSVAGLWKALSLGTKGRIASLDSVVALLDTVCDEAERAELAEAFTEAFVWPPRNLQELRRLVDWLLERIYESPSHAFVELHERAVAAARSIEERIERLEAAAGRGAALALVASDALDRLLRYETTIHRALNRDLHELERLQAMRLGRSVAVPIALDLSSDA